MADWQKFVLWGIGIVFACGMTFQQLGGIDKRVVVNTSDVKEIRADYHLEREARIRSDATVQNIRSDMSEMKTEAKEQTAILHSIELKFNDYEVKP